MNIVEFIFSAGFALFLVFMLKSFVEAIREEDDLD